jgi:uncharacterized protein YodC (DUF2158 family)
MYAKISRNETEQFERAAIVAALRWLCDPLRTMGNFQVGDVVQMKSGGPTMTINAVNNNGELFCQWFDKDGALKTGHFQAAQLKKAESDDSRAYVG